MFIWVARDKGSEWQVLRLLQQAGQLGLLPLVEAVCEPFQIQRGKPPRDPIAVVEGLADRLAALSTAGRVLVDVGNLTATFSDRDTAELLNLLMNKSRLSLQRITPVVRTSSPSEVIEVAIRSAHSGAAGLCVRVDGMVSLDVKRRVVDEVLASSGLGLGEIDIVADAQDLPRAVSHEELVAALPSGQQARTWAVVAGTFPESITPMRPDDYEHHRERGEWLAYLEEAGQESRWRRPIFGDYATQPGRYSPSPPYRPSPSVRYSTATGFVVLRGRGGEEWSAAQYIGHARFLQSQGYFKETVATAGDAYIERIATGNAKTGNGTTWRVASLLRHIELVRHQVAALGAVTPSKSRVI